MHFIAVLLTVWKATVNTRILEHDFGIQADLVHIYLVLSEKSA